MIFATEGSVVSAGLKNLDDSIVHARRLREHYLGDPHRPGYHLMVPEGMHAPVDPNAALFWNGRYHLCYIYQHEGRHCWGHVSSLDLVHWRHHLPALVPDSEDGPGDGIFSGGAFADPQGRAVISYWKYSSRSGFAIATSTDENLDTWTKHPGNPLILEAPGQRGIARVAGPDGAECIVSGADPSAIWMRDGRYYVLTGNLKVMETEGLQKNNPECQGDTLFLFESDDLTHWRYLHAFYRSDRRWTDANEDCMCPDFFPLPASPEGGAATDKHMLLFISHNHGCQYYIGEYRDDRFFPEQHGRMSWRDREFFAPESLADARGRRIMWAWIINPRGPGQPLDKPEGAAQAAAGWAGEMSLPRVLWLGEDGTLRIRPAPELEALRHRPVELEERTIPAGARILLDEPRGRSIEIEAEFEIGKVTRVGIEVCGSEDGHETTPIYYDAAEGTLNMDTRASGPLQGTRIVESAPLSLPAGEPLRLRVFVDKCIVEVFANDRLAIARHVFPSAESGAVRLFAEGGEARLRSMRAWQMMPSNPW